MVIVVVASLVVVALTSFAQGVLAGPQRRAAFGSGILAGIALGERFYGLIVVSSTTGWLYWALIGVAGVALLTTQSRGAGRLAHALLVVVVALADVGAFFTPHIAVGSAPTNV